MIKRAEAKPEEILEALCDCCGKPLSIDFLGRIEDHMKLTGSKDGKIVEAVVCLPCVDEKLSFINFSKRDSGIGYC